MASLGIVLLAGISYSVIITLISGNASEYSENEILRRLEVIEELNSALKIENARLRLKTTGLRKQIDAARRQDIELKETVNEVNEWMHFQKDNNSNIEIQSGRWSVLRMPDHQAKESQPDNSISSVQRRIPPGADFSDLPVAFYAYIDYQGAFLTLSSHTTLVFDSIKINDGNGYNNSDGIFTARRTGVYAFHWSVTIYYDSWASVELVVNETPIGCVAAETQVVKKWGRGSGLVITNINNGDRVFLRMQENGLGSIRISDRGRTSFSGWLLQP